MRKETFIRSANGEKEDTEVVDILQMVMRNTELMLQIF
jgi:hypothetical protein